MREVVKDDGGVSWTLDALAATGRRGDWRKLADVFAEGREVPAADGHTRANYVMSFLGKRRSPLKWADRIIGACLHRWWIGHRIYGGGLEGITTTSAEVRPLWRILFPGYVRIQGVRGDELFDFKVRSCSGTIDQSQTVSALDWYLDEAKLPRFYARHLAAAAQWFQWELTRSEVVEVAPGLVLGRVNWRFPGTNRWYVTSYYAHTWPTGDRG